MAKGINLLSKTSDYTRSYKDIRGVERSGSGTDISTYRFAYAENMYRDYEGDSPGAVESVPGFRRLYSFGSRINGIYLHKSSATGDHAVVQAGRSLYRFKISEMDALNALTPIATLASDKSSSFSFGDYLYVIDGSKIIRIDGAGAVKEIGTDLAYVPTTYFNSEPYEQRNLLTDAFIEKHRIEDPVRYAYSTPG